MSKVARHSYRLGNGNVERAVGARCWRAMRATCRAYEALQQAMEADMKTKTKSLSVLTAAAISVLPALHAMADTVSPSAFGEPGTTVRVSVGANGEQLMYESAAGSISPDGRYVSFLRRDDPIRTHELRIYDGLTGAVRVVAAMRYGRAPSRAALAPTGNYWLSPAKAEKLSCMTNKRNTQDRQRQFKAARQRTQTASRPRSAPTGTTLLSTLTPLISRPPIRTTLPTYLYATCLQIDRVDQHEC